MQKAAPTLICALLVCACEHDSFIRRFLAAAPAAQGGPSTNTIEDGGVGGTAGAPNSSAGQSSGLPNGGREPDNDGGPTGASSGDNMQPARSLACGTRCTDWEPVCLDGKCVLCEPNPIPTHCENNIPEACDDTGHWLASPQGACAGYLTCDSGACACPFTMCGETCSDPSTDSHNCGSCGHGCQGGTCSKGECQPSVLAHDPAYVLGILISGADLYWVDVDKSVMKLTLPDNVASSLPLPSECTPPLGGLVTHSGDLFFASFNVCSLPLAGGSAKNTKISSDLTLGSDESGLILQPLAVNDDSVFGVSIDHIDSTSGTFYSYARWSVHGITADSQTLYWLARDASGRGLIQSCPTRNACSMPFTLATDVDISDGIAVYEGFVYWTAANAADAATGSILRVSSSAKTPQTPEVIATMQADPSGIAIDPSGIYWTNNVKDKGAVMHIAFGDIKPLAIATDQDRPHSIALDTGAVYWNADGPSAIMKVAK